MNKHRKSIINTHIKTYLALFSGIVLVSGVFAFYFLWLAPQARVHVLSNDIHELYTQAKEGSLYMEQSLNNWDSFIEGDFDSKTERLESIENDFNNLYENLNSISYGLETEELGRIMKEYAQKGKNTAGDMLNTAQYFKKVEKAVLAFNNLNLETSTIDELKKLVLDFKSVSSDSLSQLEEITPPEVLLEIDKSYKDLLRQYIQSANALSAAIEKNNETEIDKVGKEADSQIDAISIQLSVDLKAFIERSDMALKIKIMKDLAKTADSKLEKLKNTYRV